MTINRADLLPGQIVEVRQRYLVTDRRSNTKGEHKLRHLPPDELVIVRGRWRVHRSRTESGGYYPTRNSPTGWAYLRHGMWIAELPDPNGSATPSSWECFDTHAEAIAYADRQARRPL